MTRRWCCVYGGLVVWCGVLVGGCGAMGSAGLGEEQLPLSPICPNIELVASKIYNTPPIFQVDNRTLSEADRVTVPSTIPVTEGASGGANGKVTLLLHDLTTGNDVTCTYTGTTNTTYGLPSCTNGVTAGTVLSVTRLRLRLAEGVANATTHASRVDLVLPVSACGCITGDSTGRVVSLLADTICDDKQSCDGLGSCVACGAAGSPCQPANLCKTGILQCPATSVRPQCMVQDNQPKGTPCGTNQVCDGSGTCCTLKTWFLDQDGDGFGGSTQISACTQPAGYIATGGDCNDQDKRIHPGAPEVCDGVDDNCNNQVDEGSVCAAGCTGYRFDQHAYMLCTTPTSGFGAFLSCSAGMQLVRVDSAAENAFLVGIDAGQNFWIGGNDTQTDGVWRWADGTQFWSGNASGMAVGGLYNNWGAGEPDDSGPKMDCALANANTGRWHARNCNAAHHFICEQTP